MKIIKFNWNNIVLEDSYLKKMEERFKDDLSTLLPEKVNAASVIFVHYFPALSLSGYIVDFSENKLFDFECKISNNHTTTYVDLNNNKTIK